jgi:hypothetical protein
MSRSIGERGPNREEELALAGGGVGAGDVAGQDPQSDSALVQFVGEGEDFID